MKFMNNHYGQSIIFKHARMAAPDGSEGLGDGAGVDGSGGGSGSNPDDGATDDADDEPSIDDLKAQLAKAKADAEMFKNASDKNAREAKKYKGQLNDANSQLRAKMTDAERVAQAKQERDEEFEEIQKELRTIKYSKRLIGVGMSETDADAMANVIPAMEDADAFFDALGKFVESVRKTSGEAAVQKLLKDRPEINAGNGDSAKDDPAMVFAKQAVERSKSSVVGTNNNIIKNFL